MAHPRRFRFGVQSTLGNDLEQWRDHVKRVESLGYSTVFMPDHFDETVLAPLPALAAVASATDTLRVGTLVLGNDYKHPAVVAKEAATIDVLSGGRVELGIGAGWMRADYDELGLEYDRASIRIERLDEAVQVLKGCWAEGAFSFKGEHYTITDYDATPGPVQQPRIPILVGGGGQKLLTLAGREADIVGINPNLRAGVVSADAALDTVGDMTAKKIGWVRDGAGARFDDIELQIRYFLAAINEDRVAFAEAVAPAFGVSAEEALDSGVACVGTVDEVCDQLQRRRDEWGVSYIVIGDDSFEAFAPVVERLAGT